MRNIYVPLPDTAVERLRELAAHEFRGAKEQAAVLILEGLRRSSLPGTDDEVARRAPAVPIHE